MNVGSKTKTEDLKEQFRNGRNDNELMTEITSEQTTIKKTSDVTRMKY